eukprot:g27126.t1
MSEEKKTEGGLTKRFDGDGSNPAKDYERWRRWCRAHLTVQKAKGVGPEAHGSLVFSLLDGTALRALDQVSMDRVEEIGGEEVIFQILDDRFPAEATHDRLGSVLDQVFDLKVEKGETTAVFTGKVRAAFSSAEAEGVVLPDVARGYLLLRFAKLSAERKAVVMAAARQSYAEKDVAAALRTTFPEGLYSAARQSSHAYQVEYDQGQVDDDEETMEEEFDVYLTDAGYQPEEEIEERDAIDALLTWKQTRSSIAQTKLSRGFGNQGQLKKLAARVKCFKCRQVGHFSRDCPKRGKKEGKGSTKDGNNQSGGGTKVNYVFMVWSQPDTPNIRTEYHWTVDENEDGELEQNYNPPIGPELYGHEMQALVAGWSHVPGDFWYTRGSEVIREHVLPRTRLFTPAASNCPVPLQELCDSRSTHLFKEDGSQAVHFSHNWKARGEAHKDIGVEWTGRTVFYMKDLPFTPIDEEIDMLAQAYKDELDTAQDEALKESGSEDSMMEETDEEAEYLDGETIVALVHAAGHGVVDTRCGRGLVGEKTLQRHEKVLNEHGYEIKEMLHQPHKFRYGNSAVDVSHRTVQIPVFLAGVQLWLRVHVVPGGAPLLISKRFMKCLGAIIDMRQGQVTFTRAHLAVPLLEQRDGSYQINLLDFQKPPKIKDAEVEVLATDLGEEDEEEGDLNVGDDPMGTIPEDEMEEYTRGSEVLFARAVEAAETVKIDTKGLKEIEMRALMEVMTYRYAKSEEEFKKTIVQTRASCKAKLPLEMVDSKQFRGEKGVLTMTYTVNTQMLQLQTGAAYLDRAETTMETVLMHYKDLLKENKVTPMLEGTGEWGEAFRTVLHEGVRSCYFEEKIEEGQPSSEKGYEPPMVRAMTPTDVEFCAAVPEENAQEPTKASELQNSVQTTDAGDMDLTATASLGESAAASTGAWPGTTTPEPTLPMGKKEGLEHFPGHLVVDAFPRIVSATDIVEAFEDALAFCEPLLDSEESALSLLSTLQEWGLGVEEEGPRPRKNRRHDEAAKRGLSNLIAPPGELEGDSQKFICVFQVGLEDDEEFCLVKRILGKAGNNMRRIADECNAKARGRRADDINCETIDKHS